MKKKNYLTPIDKFDNNIFLENIVFSEYEDTSWEYKEWLKENFESEWNWFKFEELNRISFLLTILNLLKKEKIPFSDKNNVNTRLVVNTRKLEKYINESFLTNSTNWNIENVSKVLKTELLKTEKLLDQKSDFYEKSKKIF